MKFETDGFALAGIPKGARVAVAMSGGVDSSVVAALMHKEGYQVVGITLQLYDHGEAIQKTKTCCAGQDIYDARRVSEKIGFHHYVLDYESIFKEEVIDDFADSYLRGETPIPCVQCNQKIKFRDLLRTARDLDCAALVTGHYVQNINGELHQAHDPSRDQSYFLFSTKQQDLNYLRFPLGGIPKSQTRILAEEFGLEIANKPDSQDICFVPNGNYAQTVAKLRPEALIAGDIVNLDGKILGQHQGIIHYTIGQRRGLGIASVDPLYVVALDPIHNQVIVGPRSALAVTHIPVQDVNWFVDLSKYPCGFYCTVKVRSTGAALSAKVQMIDESHALVTLDQPEYGVSSGQACVFYDGTRVIGGGWIKR
nr:tRNA-specific 2-thiouridylase MnmA [uncultured bacterium]